MMAEIRTLTTNAESSRASAIATLEQALDRLRAGEATGCAVVLTLPGGDIETNYSEDTPRWLLVGGLFDLARQLSQAE